VLSQEPVPAQEPGPVLPPEQEPELEQLREPVREPVQLLELGLGLGPAQPQRQFPQVG